MTWSAVYNQVLCGLFLLLAFYFLLRYIETDRALFNLAQWIVFLLGFGALEINVMYPALAASYTLLCAALTSAGLSFYSFHRRYSP